LETEATPLSDRVREAEGFPEIVVAREAEEVVRDVLEVDECRGFEV
jgi:hypothetical protein